ncbi:ADP-ribose pyrophosphatase [Agromyces cerinus]|uniref:NUDIX hydrolase n=1 Tax=Agromyces cerinus TaxID=33878 RepID=UPI00195A55CC|nr:NUDIX domain-containing protein [Agromyces cerinus]MBM7829677.1 ADP-ribose pyrophosphatase [Agromyces cerinus]
MGADRERVYHWNGPPEIELWREPVRLATGLEYTAHALRVQGGRPGVVVIARSGDDLLFVQTERPAVGGRLLELPRGFGEADPADPSAPVSDALRELAEETGLRARDARVLGSYVTDSSILPGAVVVVACVVDERRPSGPTDRETERAVWVPRTGIARMVVSGALRDAHTLSALAMLQADETTHRLRHPRFGRAEREE